MTAASGQPLAETTAAMAAAEQPYSSVPGAIFAACGIMLGLGWAILLLLHRGSADTPGWLALLLWSVILVPAGPAYFILSFGNLNGVGDTYADWNSAAAFAFEAPLYVISSAGVVGACAAAIAGLVARHRAGRSADPPAGLTLT